MRIVFSAEDRLAGAPQPARSALVPWLASGALDIEECVSAAELLAHFDETSPEMALLTALVLRAPSEGHSCLRLSEVEPRLASQRERVARSATHIESDASGQLTLYSGSAASNVRTLEPLPPVPTYAALDAALRASPLCAVLNEVTGTQPRSPLLLIGERLYAHRYLTAEAQVGAALLSRAEQGQVDVSEARASLAAWIPTQARRAQREAVERAVANNLLLLTGGPGTGKTWTVRNVLAARMALAEERSESTPRIALAAPTGKAAARMGESLSAQLDAWSASLLKRNDGPAPRPEQLQRVTAQLRELNASTLHRLLGYRRDNPTRFRHNRDNPLPADIVVIDEVSMVDTLMMARLLDACAPETLVVLIGDPNQLASVDAGSVLADIVDAAADNPRLSACHVHLDESQRFADDKQVGQMTKWVLDGGIGELPALSWHAIGERALPPETLETLAEPYVELARAAQSWSGGSDETAVLDERAEKAFELLDRYRILSSRRSGNFGVGALNLAVLNALRERGLVSSRASLARPFPGIPLMVMENGYGVGRFNGDIGVMVARDTAAFENAAGGYDLISPTRLPAFQPAWAMTIHKSQGSEFDHVCVVLPPDSSRLHTRELLYTAVSRARETVALAATPDSVRECAKHEIARASGLKEMFATLKRADARLRDHLVAQAPVRSVSAHYR